MKIQNQSLALTNHSSFSSINDELFKKKVTPDQSSGVTSFSLF